MAHTAEEREMLAGSRQAREDAAADARIAQTAEGIRQALYRAANLPENEQDAGRIARLEARLAEVEAVEAAEAAASFTREWTRETTISRRQAWNDAARKLPRGHGPASIVATLGFRLDDLKRAIALHGL